MRPRHRLFQLNLIVATVFALSGAVPASSVAADTPPSGHILLTGRAAAQFTLPADVRQTSSWHDSRFGLDYARYQQFAAPLRTYVEGAQLTIVRRGDEQVLVIGAHHPGLRVDRAPLIDGAAAIDRAAADALRSEALPRHVAGLVKRQAQLRVDPDTGRLFYLVSSGAPGVNLFHEIDAQTGAVIDSWDGIEHDGTGTGVKGDTKDLTSGSPVVGSLGDLTWSNGSGTWLMRSADGLFETYDAKGKDSYGSTLMSDSGWGNDNLWNASYERAAVDAQYYAALTVAFYREQYAFDLIGDCPYGAIRSVVHYDETPGVRSNYDNAFWDSISYYMVYGDGNGSDTRALSAGQDVVSHELTHAVTQCRTDLGYKNEYGALNEAFSDIMATAAEWDLEEPLSSNCRLAAGQTRCADWLLGEDIIIDPTWAAIRDFANPASQGQPSHYDDRVFYSWDNGGVHFNSGIVNHAFYLLVNGGRNARCSGPADPQADCDIFVPPISLAHAERIFFTGFGLLTEQAKMCEARDATLTAATELLYPGSMEDQVAIDLAWQAVGRSEQDCTAAPAGFSISLADRTLALAPDAAGELHVDLQGGSQNGPITFQVEHTAPMQPTFDPSQSVSPNDGTTLSIDADAGAASGAYPLLISAADGTQTRYASAALIVDGIEPDVAVTSVRFVSGATVLTNGTVPLRVYWTANDGQSGLSSAELDHSLDGSAWTSIYGPGTPTGVTNFSTTADTHQFRVVGLDAVGNGTTSEALVTSLVGAQETAATYKRTWRRYNAGTAWGTTRFAKRRGAAAIFKFTGTDVVWVAERGPKRGKARVYVDGVRTVVDLYASSSSHRRVVFVAANLAAGQHTLKIVVRGTSGRPRVDVDGFFVLDQ